MFNGKWIKSIRLAVILQAFQFEHRDMHRGNILVKRTNQEHIYFRLDGVEYSIKSYGVMATVVDYTFSRIKQGVYYYYPKLQVAMTPGIRGSGNFR